MNYEMISPPLDLDFHESSEKELKKFYQWYLRVIPERVEVLTKAVQSTPGFESWSPDYTPNSLNKLGEWFAENLETRKRTKEEIKAIYSRAPAWFKSVEIGETVPTNRTFSLAIDIGMYLSQVFLKNNPSLTWMLYQGHKNSVDYGQPVLTGFGQGVFNPIRMTQVQAHGLSDGTYKGSGLRELYDIWIKLIK